MAAATTPINTDKLLSSSSLYQQFPVKGGETIQYGWIVMLDTATGYVLEGAAATGCIAVGRADGPADNATGADGDATIQTECGVFYYQNSAGDAISALDFGKVCYIEDNQTVAKTDGGATLSPAGIVYELRDDGLVGVRMDPTSYPST